LRLTAFIKANDDDDDDDDDDEIDLRCILTPYIPYDSAMFRPHLFA